MLQRIIFIINRENVVWLVNRYRSCFPFGMVVIDELSSFKSPKAHHFKALRNILPYITRIVGLTGTPAPNGLIDLWSQRYLLDQGLSLGKHLSQYREKYFFPNRRNGPAIYDCKLKLGVAQLIHQAISGICISMKSADYLELPSRIDHYIKVRLDKDKMKKHPDFEETLMFELKRGEEITAINAAVLSGKLRQFANGAVYKDNKNFITIHDAKLQALKEFVEQSNGNPVLIVYKFWHDLICILQALKKYNPQSLSSNDSLSNCQIVKSINCQILRYSRIGKIKKSPSFSTIPPPPSMASISSAAATPSSGLAHIGASNFTSKPMPALSPCAGLTCQRLSSHYRKHHRRRCYKISRLKICGAGIPDNVYKSWIGKSDHYTVVR